MTDFTTEVTQEMIDPVTGEIIDQEIAERLLAQAKEQGVSLVGSGGLLNQLTRNVLETALEAELTEHLGHEHGQRPVVANMRNGTRVKTVLTEIGPVEIEVPRGREGSFDGSKPFISERGSGCPISLTTTRITADSFRIRAMRNDAPCFLLIATGVPWAVVCKTASG